MFEIKANKRLSAAPSGFKKMPILEYQGGSENPSNGYCMVASVNGYEIFYTLQAPFEATVGHDEYVYGLAPARNLKEAEAVATLFYEAASKKLPLERFLEVL